MMAHKAFKSCTEHVCYWIVLQASSQSIHTIYKTLCLGIMVVIIPLHVLFQCPQQAPDSQHSQGYKTQVSYACISCAPEKAPEFGTFSTLATALSLTAEFEISVIALVDLG